MKHLYIIGARGFGREVYNLAKETQEYQIEFTIAGFLDDKKDALRGYEGYPPIISSVEDYIPQKDDVFICALGDTYYKRKYVEIMLAKHAEFISLIHKDAYISENVKYGKGCIFCANSRISCDISIGNFNTFQPYVTVGHDVKTGNFNHFNTYSFMGGFVEIGNGVTLHTAAIIHPHKKIHDNAIVGAGAFVIRNVPADVTVYGNPAKKLK